MLVNRVGTFFILMGLFLIGLFIYSDIVDMPMCGLLVSGAVVLALGLFMWFRNPAPPPQPTGRFRLLQKKSKDQNSKK